MLMSCENNAELRRIADSLGIKTAVGPCGRVIATGYYFSETGEKISEELKRKKTPVNTFRAVRQFERFFGGRIDLNGPGYERMTSEEYQEARIRDLQFAAELEDDPDKGKLIGTHIYNTRDRTITYKRAPIDQPQEEKL